MPHTIRDRSELVAGDTPAAPDNPKDETPKDETLPRVEVTYKGPPRGASYGGRELVPGKPFEAPALDALAMLERFPGLFEVKDLEGARTAGEAQRKITTDAELETKRLEAEAAKTTPATSSATGE